MKNFAKVSSVIIGTCVTLIMVLSVANPAFGTYIGERLGYFMGASFVLLTAASPIIVFIFLVWFLFFRQTKKGSTQDDTRARSDKISKLDILGEGRTGGSDPSRHPIQPSEMAHNSTHSKTTHTKTENEQSHASALKVIEYSSVASEAWRQVKSLPQLYQAEFLDELERSPSQDAAALAARLLSKHQRELRPYDNSEVNDALEQARTISQEAADEFVEVYNLLGASLNADDILAKIEKKYDFSERAKAIKPGLYKADRLGIFRVYPDLTVKILKPATKSTASKIIPEESEPDFFLTLEAFLLKHGNKVEW